MTTVTSPARSGLRFELPPERSATSPPEARGVARDQVRLMVARPDRVTHTRVARLGEHLRAGDLLVVNTSATLPAALDGSRPDGAAVVAHVAGPHPDDDGSWIVELRAPDASTPVRDAAAGLRLHLAGDAELTLLAAHPDAQAATSRLWRAAVDVPQATLLDHLVLHGRPIAYDYVAGRWPLDSYQTVFARTPGGTGSGRTGSGRVGSGVAGARAAGLGSAESGAAGLGSAEMASAARPFTAELVTDLVTRGITVAPLVLHSGVSSLEASEPPEPERFEVPDHTAALVEHTRRRGGRVVAVGTTVTRALETVAMPDGSITPGSGWTGLVLSTDRPARVVDGLVTGWHASDASHLALLEAVAGPELVERVYAAALEHDYLWHEFGDSCLLLP